MIVEKARAVLGTKYKMLNDSEIEMLINFLDNFAEEILAEGIGWLQDIV